MKEQTRIREHGTRVTNPGNFADPGIARIEAVRQVVRRGAYAKIDGCMVDLYTASAIVKVYDAINETNKAKYRALDVRRMGLIAFKLIGEKQV